MRTISTGMRMGKDGAHGPEDYRGYDSAYQQPIPTLIYLNGRCKLTLSVTECITLAQQYEIYAHLCLRHLEPS